LIFEGGRSEDDVFTVIAAHPPQSAATTDENSDGKLLAGPAKLDVAVGKTQAQNLRFGPFVTGGHERPAIVAEALGLIQPSRRLLCMTLKDHAHYQRLLRLVRGRHLPQLAPATKRVANVRRRMLCPGIDLKVSVRIADLVTPTWHERGVPGLLSGKTAPFPSRESLACAPLVLAQEHSAKFGKHLGRVVQCPEDCLPVRE
jgi:hypothetical protein